MHISKFQIRNYKSFLESDEIELETGFNVIVGKNNSGKTALVEALSLKYQDRPHRSLKTLPSPDAHIENESTVGLSISLSGDELKEAWLNRGINRIQISGNILQPEERGKEFLTKLRGNNLLHCIFDSDTFTSAYLDNEPPDESQSVARLEIDPIERTISPSSDKLSGVPSYGRVAANQLRERIYYFDAERLNVGNCASSGRLSLKPDASNLAEVIHVLQNTNPARFQRFVQNVKKVLPNIKYVTAPQIESSGTNKYVEVQVWNVPVETERHDLAIPLAESGTGIGQVLAILYVVLNADRPSVIIIDEPNSFLHPGAMRRLIGILKQHPEHQYIMTTHSPAVITAAEPSTLTLARLEGSRTKLQELDVSETEDLRVSLAEVGARLSDVFGADDILWVEGRTEELCFPPILEKIANQPLLGTEILGVEHTGDFEGRHAETIFDIYDKLSKGRGLLPPAVGFIFDKEGRSKQDREDLIRKSKSRGSIRFTARRMYENCLLHPGAIAAIINRDDESRGEPVTANEVQGWIDDHGAEFTKDDLDVGSDDWLRDMHAANLLDELFSALTETRLQFDKVHHSTALTKWLIEHSPEDLQEIADMLVEAIRHEDLSQTVDAAPTPSNH